MNDPVELYCTQDTDSGEWLVWFPHPLGGMNVLETFDSEAEARVYWQQQIDSADFDAEQTMHTKEEVATFIKEHMDFARFARLTRALGDQVNDAQLRFIKALIFENSIEEYSSGQIHYVGQEGCDLIIPSLSTTRVEMKYVENALYTSSRRELREHTGNIKLMNSMGTNTHKKLPTNYADFLIFIGNQGAMLFDRATIDLYIKPGGDGITADIPTSKGIILATPSEMFAGAQQQIDFVDGLKKYIRAYISNVK